MGALLTAQAIQTYQNRAMCRELGAMSQELRVQTELQTRIATATEKTSILLEAQLHERKVEKAVKNAIFSASQHLSMIEELSTNLEKASHYLLTAKSIDNFDINYSDLTEIADKEYFTDVLKKVESGGQQAINDLNDDEIEDLKSIDEIRKVGELWTENEHQFSEKSGSELLINFVAAQVNLQRMPDDEVVKKFDIKAPPIKKRTDKITIWKSIRTMVILGVIGFIFFGIKQENVGGPIIIVGILTGVFGIIYSLIRNTRRYSTKERRTKQKDEKQKLNEEQKRIIGELVQEKKTSEMNHINAKIHEVTKRMALYSIFQCEESLPDDVDWFTWFNEQFKKTSEHLISESKRLSSKYPAVDAVLPDVKEWRIYELASDGELGWVSSVEYWASR